MPSSAARNRSSRFRAFVGALALGLCSGVPQSWAEFDPVNDDTDIFLANPDVPTNRPNVILILDNTANWSRNVGGQSIFINEKAALKSVVENLTADFNIGLMMFPETGQGNDNIDGAYPRFAVRHMVPENKSVLMNLINGLHENADKGNNNTVALAMMEAYRYYAGKPSRAGYGKVKTDYANNSEEPHPASVAGLGAYALDSDAPGTRYNSPIAGSCQSNFIIYISNGPANENASALSVSEAELSSLGYPTSTPIALTPSGQQGNWMDEWARYMANADVNADFEGDQHVYTYVVEVDPVLTGQGPAMTALMKSAALNGKGKYFAVSSGNAGQAIVNALNEIFQEIQAVNSVFASTTLPVSVNVRGTNLNQVYIGVFRPDDAKRPRWFGNLKMYQLGFDQATGSLFLADVNKEPAENPDTGFINSTSASFWTHASTYWGFRQADLNGPGGASDLPDGDLVEKGGTAQQQRDDFASDQTVRRLYTCTGACGPGSPLADTPFSVDNPDITAASLGLGAVALSSLTAKESRTVTELTDVRPVSSLSTAGSAVPVVALENNVTSLPITSLTTTKTIAISSMSNNPVVKTFNDLNRGSGASKQPVVATVNNHGYSTGQVVHIAGVGANEYNGTFTITVTGPNTFTYYANTAGNPANNPNITNATITTTSSIVTVNTVGPHGLTSGQQVTISGVTPNDFNSTYTINVVDADTFTFSTAAALAPVTSVAGAVASTPSTTATATTGSPHSYSVGQYVTVAGANPAGYNGLVQVTGIPAPNQFQYTVGSALATATGTITVSQGSTTVNVKAPGHPFSNGQVVTITGANPAGFNGSFTIFNVDTDSFSYTTSQPLPANTGTNVIASSGTSSVVTAFANDHKFGKAGDIVNLIIEGVTNFPAAYNGTVTATIVDENSFTYETKDGTAPDPATGTITARLASPTAFATVPAHGFGNEGDTLTVTISGANDSDYNRVNVTATVLDEDTLTYPLLTVTAQGPATGDITISRNTTTARALAVNHGFADGANIAIAGANPPVFNGTFTITVLDNDNFTFTIPTPAGDATGSIMASGGSPSGTDVENIINWVRGADNFEDEDSDGLFTDVRASIHGDVLHSRPAVVNYNRHGNDNDVYVFYGANDGIFRAIKGGEERSASGEPDPGHEAWGFIPEEFFSKLPRLRNNAPLISSHNKKPYFADGSIGTYVKDVNGDGKLVAADGDIVWLFVSMRRGGRFLYALDVSDPQNPKLLWRRSNSDPGWAELGQTWSLPRVVELGIDDDNNSNTPYPLLIFGAGYDPLVEDVPSEQITAVDAEGVKVGAAEYKRSMGRGIFVVEAATGELVWQAGPPGSNPKTTDPTLTHHYEEVDGMDFAIPSDVTVIRDRNGSVLNRAYVGDTGGNVWRIDMNDPDVSKWKVTRLASLADYSGLPGDRSGLRKFQFPPDVVYHEDGYDAVLIGSGDREHPFDTAVQNRMYMIKDTGIGTTPIRGTGATDGVDTTVVEDDLFDATSNCIQDSSACNSSAGEDPSTALADLHSADGWYITLGTGEKVIGNAVTLNSVTFFNTNQPSGASGTGANCSSDLGIARQYKVRFDDATSILDQNIDGVITALDRSTVHPGGGYLPSPVPVVVQIDGQTHEGVISGVAVDDPPGSLLNARLRKFWFKEME